MTNRVIYYYQTFTGLKKILYQDTPVTNIHLSAIHFGNNKDGTPYIHLNNDDFNDAKFNSVWSELREAVSLNIKVILMIGGAGSAYGQLFNNYETYYPMLIDSIRSKLDIISGVDLDIEESVDLNDVKKLMNDLINEFGVEFAITMAPVVGSMETDTTGMGGFCYKDLYTSPEGRYIEYFNVQDYNSYQFEDFQNIVLNGYPESKIVLGMIGGQDMEQVLTTLINIKEVYPKMGGAFIWEYCLADKEWDKKIASIFTNIYSNTIKTNSMSENNTPQSQPLYMVIYDTVANFMIKVSHFFFNDIKEMDENMNKKTDNDTSSDTSEGTSEGDNDN